VDFHPGGSLAIPGANEDALRIEQFIRTYMDDIENIIITQDSHQLNHIAHGVFWENINGESPAPFTQITYKQICDGLWFPKDKTKLKYCKQYAKALEGKGKFVLTIWPVHCLVGSPGHNVVPAIHRACLDWMSHKNKEIEYVMKGQNCLTEMYSAIMAEIPIPDDPSTHLNSGLLRRLQSSKQLVVCGQALSHCVNFTVRDLVDNWRSEVSRILIMRDGCSPVPGFEKDGENFLNDMKKVNVKVFHSTDDFLVE
jgi:nicotinamidase-related amidase